MASLSIFNLKQEHNDIVDALIENDGLLTPELEAALEMNKTNFLEKAEKVSFIVRKLEGDLELIDSEIERLKKLKKKVEKSKESLDSFLMFAVENFGEVNKKSKAKYPPKSISLPLGSIQVTYSEKLDVSTLEFSDVQAVPEILRPFARISFKEKFDLQRASLIVSTLRQNIPYEISFDNENIKTILKISEKVKEKIPLNQEEQTIWNTYQNVPDHVSMKIDSKVKL